MLDGVTPEEERLLQPRSAPRLPRNRSGLDTGTVRHKEDVTPEEYRLRLERQSKRDAVLVAQDKQRRTEAAMTAWKEEVGATFAEAQTDHPAILDRVNRLVTGTGRHKTSLVFYGNLGTGKSWHAYAFIAEAMKRGALTPGQIVQGTETAIIGDIAAGGFTRTERIRTLQSPRNKVFFIDDVGQGYFSREEARTEAWFELVNHVYTRQLTLLLTTNKKPTVDSLGAWVGARAYDRLMSLLGGPEGFITLGNVNRRPAVAEANERRTRQQTPPTAGRTSPY